MDDFRDCLDARQLAARLFREICELFTMRGMVGSVTLVWVLRRIVRALRAAVVRQN